MAAIDTLARESGDILRRFVDESTLIRQANAILHGRIDLLGATPTLVGEHIDWNFDYRTGRPTPTGFSYGIDYRDFDVTGDCKWVWELNRHHALVVLGRAYHVTRDERYARAIVAQMASWLDQCPFLSGMNWRSPLELAIRLINWVCAIELIAPSGVMDPAWADRVFAAAHRHLWEINRRYSRYSSANNHLIGEAAGVYIASAFFDSLRMAAPWRKRAREILCREMARQTHDDGGHRELATGYQVFVMQFFTLTALVAQRIGEPMPGEFMQLLERMYEYIAALTEAGPMPMLGDADDGYVLDLGGSRGDPKPWLSVAASMFDRSDFAAAAGNEREALCWLRGADEADRISRLASRFKQRRVSLQTRVFPDTGMYLLQADTPAGALSMTVDCGALGFDAIAAHGHADALAVTLRLNGSEFLVDSGTYDYFTHPSWRRHFRSTAAHNTLEIDGCDQSEILGPFLWGQRANVRVICEERSAHRSLVSAEHDGYMRLASPVRHRRTVELIPARCRIRMDDELACSGSHEVRQYFQFSPQCRVDRMDAHSFSATRPEGQVTLSFDARCSVQLIIGDATSMRGFVSTRYHVKSPAALLVASCKIIGSEAIRTILSVTGPASGRNMTSHSDAAYNQRFITPGCQVDSTRTGA